MIQTELALTLGAIALTWLGVEIAGELACRYLKRRNERRTAEDLGNNFDEVI